MNQFLCLVFCLQVFEGYAQVRTYTLADMPFIIDSATGGVVYEGTVEVPGATADQLYLRAKSFFWLTFPNENQVIKADNPIDGFVSGNGKVYLRLNNSPQGTAQRQIYYEVPVEIKVKDGHYSYRIANIQIVNNGVTTSLDAEMKKALPQIRQQTLSETEYQRSMTSVRPFTQLIRNLNQRMKSRSKAFANL
ncbi:DUF4468 domain-containing protein [Spirosoma sp. SC4-14]|uniref:DUF4468 domain-containing protein n=1 Tax=Spirosoma sp. SC4-14 TaxID=3128900 RepID=UPI0030D5DC1C